MGHRAPNCQQLMNINLFVEDSSYGFVVTHLWEWLHPGLCNIQLLVYHQRKHQVGESSQFKIGCFYGGICLSDIGWWGKVESTDK